MVFEKETICTKSNLIFPLALIWCWKMTQIDVVIFLQDENGRSKRIYVGILMSIEDVNYLYCNNFTFRFRLMPMPWSHPCWRGRRRQGRWRTRRRTRPSTWRLFSKFSAQAKNCKVEELLFIVISSNIITISNFRFSVPSNLIKLPKNGGCFGKWSLDRISLDRNCHFSLDRKF